MKKMLGAAVAAVVLAFAGSASAATMITTIFSGTITSASNTEQYFGLYSPGLVDRAFQVSFDWDQDETGGNYYSGIHYVTTLGAPPPTRFTMTLGDTAFDFLLTSFQATQLNGSTSYSVRGNDGLTPFQLIASAYGPLIGPHPYGQVGPAEVTGRGDFLMANGDGTFARINFAMTTFQVISGIPEPTTWAMMILGFGMAGTALRRRQAAMFQSTPI